MSFNVQPRRWAVDSRHGPKQTERAVTPEEARAALLSALLHTGAGLQLEEVIEYDPRKDVFIVLARARDGKLNECIVRGETVASIVHVARILGRENQMIAQEINAAKIPVP